MFLKEIMEWIKVLFYLQSYFLLSNIHTMSLFRQHYKKINLSSPIYHFVLGSGYSPLVNEVKKLKAFEDWEERPSLLFKDIPAMPEPTIRSHEGVFRYFFHKPTGLSFVLQSGRIHAYEGHSASVVVQPVIQSFLSGTKNFIITNISGGLKKEYKIGTVIALDDHVNRTGMSPLVGTSLQNDKGEKLGDQFPDMSLTYDSKMRQQITDEFVSLGLKVVKGVYVGVLGPELETPAEIEWLCRSSQGLFDAVGMSTVLEVIALKQARANVSGFSLISNPAAGVDSEYKELSSKKMFSVIQEQAKKMIESFFIYSGKRFNKGDYE